MAHQLSFLHEQGYQRLNTGMLFSSPFIITSAMNRCDLGTCIISTSSPHFVAKIHKFETMRGNERIRERNEKARIDYLKQRVEAHSLAIEARAAGYESVKKYLIDNGKNFDEEFDEDRLVVKVPGLNVYLEMYGCLDKMEQGSLSLTDASICLQKMAQFYRVNNNLKPLNGYATNELDPQPNDDWHENYDEKEFFQFSKYLGIGFSQIDRDRRPDIKAYDHYLKKKFGDKDSEKSI